MAALFGHMDYWNVSGKMLSDELKNRMPNETPRLATISSICYLLLSITAVAGNAFVIAVMWKDPLKILRSSPTNFILLSLAVADSLVGLVLIPGAGVWYLRLAMNENPWNSLVPILLCSGFFLVVSVGHLLLIAIDRYFALTKPLEHRARVSKGRVAIASLSIWAICIGYAILSSLLRQHFLVLWFIYVLIFFFCSNFISCLYLATLKFLCKSHRARIMRENSQHIQAVLLYEREKKVFTVIASAFLVFYFCCLPWLINQFLFFFCRACNAKYSTAMICYHAGTIVIFANSALNPLLYSWRFSKFRATFKYFLAKYCYQKVRRRSRSTDVSEGRDTYNTRL